MAVSSVGEAGSGGSGRCGRGSGGGRGGGRLPSKEMASQLLGDIHLKPAFAPSDIPLNLGSCISVSPTSSAVDSHP